LIRFLHPYFLMALIPILAGGIYLGVRQRSYPILRTLALVAVVLAAASPYHVQQTLTKNVFFLVDRSASVTLTADDDEVRARMDRIMAASPDSRHGVIEFAKTAVVSTPLGDGMLSLGLAVLDEMESNLGPAVNLALSVMPEGQSNQFVLVSDGRFSDLPEHALSRAKRMNVPVSVLPAGAAVLSDVSLSSLTAPALVQIGRPFSIDMQITAASDNTVRLVVYRDNDIVTVRDLQVVAGATNLSVTDVVDRAGSFTYQAIVKASADAVSANDDLSVLVSSTERPRVLLIDQTQASHIPALLDTLGILFHSEPAVPPLEALADYRQLILTGGKLQEYTSTEIETIGHFARQLGGGVLFVNGEGEVRGFSGGDVDRLLPVSFDIPEKSEEASLAIVYLLDRSASMRSRVDGIEKIDVLKEAAVASISLLDQESLVGILAFASYGVYDWIVPMSPIDFAAIVDALRPMDAIGGTDIYFPLQDAINHLEQLEARSKHIILISDGKQGSDIRDWPGLVRRLREDSEITLSAVAVGSSPNTTLLGALVTAGGGALYLADDFTALPQVLIRATQRLSRERFATQEADITGRLAETHAVEPVPALQGYVVAYPKEAAQTLLWADTDPLVSTWRVGLGSVTALNTDLDGVWSGRWIQWGGLPQLFEGILATVESDIAAALGLTASVSFDGSTTSLVVDARTEDGAYVDFLDIQATLLPLVQDYHLSQVAPGLYHASLPTPAKGGYLIQVYDRTRDRSVSVPLSVPYSAEYAHIGQDPATLAWIAESANGVLLDDQASLPDVEAQMTDEREPIHTLFIVAAAILFLLELITRKWPIGGRARRAGA
jgi:hypothetical protein